VKHKTFFANVLDAVARNIKYQTFRNITSTGCWC